MNTSFRRIAFGVIIGCTLLTACTIAKASGLAAWTGQIRYVNAYSGTQLACQYRAPDGRTFWQLIGPPASSQCPSHMEYVEL